MLSETATVEFGVTEPHLTVQLTIRNPGEEGFAMGDVVTVAFAVSHAPDSATPAFNLGFASNSTLLSVTGESVASELGVEDTLSGEVELLMTQLPG